jgi:hypothetical protein
MLLQLRIVAPGSRGRSGGSSSRCLKKRINAMEPPASAETSPAAHHVAALYAVGSVSRNKTPPSLICFAQAKLNRSTKQDATMFTKSKIAMSVAVILSAAAVSLSTQVFAEGSHMSHDDHATSSQKGKAARAQMNVDYRGNTISGERPRQPDAQPSWIEDPASPRG